MTRMKKAYWLSWMLLAPVAGGLSCTGSTAEPSSSEGSVAVFHTAKGMYALSVDSADAGKVRTKIEDYYPAACLDDDADDDKVPDAVDDDSDDKERSDDDSDGGSSSSDQDGGDDSHQGLRCKRCNRGPGTQGDLRIKIEGTRGELGRGRVWARVGDELTIPTPTGSLILVLDASSEIRDGQPTPGSEVRAEGTIEAGKLRVQRLTVLCPGPAPMPQEAVPAEATPLTEDSSGTDAGNAIL